MVKKEKGFAGFVQGTVNQYVNINEPKRKHRMFKKK